MRFLSTRMHGYIDLAVGALLIVLPWALGFRASGAETWVPVLIGLAVISYSLLTEYEVGRQPRIDIPVHLWMDALAGLLLAISPWLLGFDREAWMPHLAAGIVLIVLALFTNTVPGFDRRSR